MSMFYNADTCMSPADVNNSRKNNRDVNISDKTSEVVLFLVLGIMVDDVRVWYEYSCGNEEILE